jgi:hypothetical protein
MTTFRRTFLVTWLVLLALLWALQTATAQVRIVATRISGGPAAAGADSFIVPQTNLFNWSAHSGAENAVERTPGALVDNTVNLATLQSTYNAMATNRDLLLTNGHFGNLSGTITLKSFKGIRGLGNTTIISNTLFAFQGYASQQVTNAITSGATFGSTNITVQSNHSTLYEVGSRVWVTQANATNFTEPLGYESGTQTGPFNGDTVNGALSLGQMVKLLSIDGTSLTFTPPLRHNYTNGARLAYHNYSKPSEQLDGNLAIGISLSNFRYVVGDTGDNLITLNGVHDAWITNVLFEWKTNHTIIGQWASRITISGCTFVGTNANGFTRKGPYAYINTDGWRVEDNAFNNVEQAFITAGRGGGHVFAYNYTHVFSNGTAGLLADVWGHGAHQSHVLIEGNRVHRVEPDFIHGSHSHWTIFRNHLRGSRWDIDMGENANSSMLGIGAGNYHMAVVGNVFGTNSPMRSGWVYMRNEDNGDPVNLGIFRVNYGGFGSSPLGNAVEQHMIRAGNWNYVSNAVDGVWTGTQSNSLLYASKPAYFGALEWPPFGPSATGYHTNLLPAEARFLGIALP